jgi:hypothetical protein
MELLLLRNLVEPALELTLSDVGSQVHKVDLKRVSDGILIVYVDVASVYRYYRLSVVFHLPCDVVFGRW